MMKFFSGTGQAPIMRRAGGRAAGRWRGLLACCLAVLLLASCGSAPAEIVLIPDLGGVEDASFNAGIWDGVRLYAGVHDKSCNYYQLAGGSDEERLDAMTKAMPGGAQVVVLAGSSFAPVLETAQAKWPDARFILVDSAPDTALADNAAAITFAQEQSGFLAGYGTVMEGYTRLGFMGGMPVPGVAGYGLGYLQGANAAAQVLELDKIEVRYRYAGQFTESEATRQQAAAWYRDGTEVIFACGGAMNRSVFTAAEQESGWAIGSDRDQSAESSRVLLSALKDVGAATSRLLGQYYDDAFPGGETLHFTAADGVVGLAMETSRTIKFTEEDYLQQIGLITSGDLRIVTAGGGAEIALDPRELDVELPFIELVYKG